MSKRYKFQDTADRIMADIDQREKNQAVTIAESIQAICKRAQDAAMQKEAREYLRQKNAQQRASEARERAIWYDRQIAMLSRRHVQYVRYYCDAEMMPRSKPPDIWGQVIAKWNWRDSVFLVGSTGVAKTTTATWAAMHCACAGDTVRQTTAVRVAKAERHELDEWRHADFLIINEVHKLDGLPEWQRAPFADLVDYRHEKMATTMATATVDADAIKKLIGVEIRRRFELRLGTD